MTVKGRNIALKAQFGADKSTAALTTLYFSLYRGQPSAGGTEPSATGAYARVAKTNDATFTGTIGASDVNLVNAGASGAITWPSSTAAYSITLELNWFGIHDAASGGNLVYEGTLASPVVVNAAGLQPRIPAGGLSMPVLE
jgi:hypothetical protein